MIAELERLDLPGPLSRTRTLVDRLDSEATTRVYHPGGLTEREWEVAGFVAQALTNQQIAHTLFLSVRTVESHVHRILAKLGLTRRTELAVWMRSAARTTAPSRAR